MTSDFATPTDTADISDVTANLAVLSRALTNTIQISDTRLVGRTHDLANTLQISNAKAPLRGIVVRLYNTLNIESQASSPHAYDVLDISNTVEVITDFIQFDSWRPVPRFDNEIVLICRTPAGDHDTVLTGMELWTVRPDGSRDRKEIAAPADNGYGWDAYDHPEWSPAGEFIVVAAETATEYKLVLLASAGFGTR